MSELIVIGYDDPFKAEETRLKLVKMQRDYLIDLEDAVVAVKDKDGKVKLNQAYPLTQMGAFGGGFWGALIGMLFLNPLLGAAVGAGERQVHEGIGVKLSSGQFRAVRSGPQGYAGQGAGGTPRRGRQDYPDFAVARG